MKGQIRERTRRITRRWAGHLSGRRGASPGDPQAPALTQLGLSLFEPDWYLDTYPDVRAAGVDPLTHFLTYGSFEHRRPNPQFMAAWYAAGHAGDEAKRDPFRHYLEAGRQAGLRFNPIVDPAFIRTAYGLSHEDEPMHFVLRHPEADRVSEWFSRHAYLAANPDVDDPGPFPEIHYLEHGLTERRVVGAEYVVNSVRGEIGHSMARCDSAERIIDQFDWAGQNYRVVERIVSSGILRQIRAQAVIDPDVVAAGDDALPLLTEYRSGDVNQRYGVDYRGILDALPTGQDVIFMLPNLTRSGPVDYAIGLVSGLRELGHSVHIVTTDIVPQEGDGRVSESLDRTGLPPPRGRAAPMSPHPHPPHARSAIPPDVTLASLGRLLGNEQIHETSLGLSLLRASPRYLFIIDSDLALRTIRRHGRALASQMRIMTAFTGADGASLSAQFLRGILPFSEVLSDDPALLESYATRVGPTAASRLHLLAPRMVSDGLPSAQTPMRSMDTGEGRRESARRQVDQRNDAAQYLEALRALLAQST